MSVPSPGAYSTYNPKPGLDPVWDAYMATYTAKYANAGNDATFGKTKLQDEYNRGIKELDLAAPGQRAATEYGLLSRGIGRSGEAVRRRTETETGMAKQRLDADRTRLEGITDIERQLAEMYSELSTDRELRIAESRERLLARKDHPDIPGVGVPGVPSVPTPGLDPLLTPPGPTTRGRSKVKAKPAIKKPAAKKPAGPAPPADSGKPVIPPYKPLPPAYTPGGKSSGGQGRF